MRTPVWFGLTALLLALTACSTSNADGPPGSTSSVANLALPRFPQGGFQGEGYFNVLVIAPAPGARCRGDAFNTDGFAGDDGLANADREVMIRVNQDARRVTITCRHDGATVRRAVDRLVLAASGSSDSPLGIVEHTGYPPLIHVPNADGGAAARWEAWRSENCTGPHIRNTLGLLCVEAYDMARAADLGAN